MMHPIPIDEAGYIDNPHVIKGPELECEKPWGALVFRRGKKIMIASFLPKENNGKKISVSGIPRGVYLAFGSTGEKGKTRSLFVVDQVTKNEILLRSVVDTDVPSIYDIDSIAPTRIYILEAKLAMMEVQIDNFRREMLDVKSATPIGNY